MHRFQNRQAAKLLDSFRRLSPASRRLVVFYGLLFVGVLVAGSFFFFKGFQNPPRELTLLRQGVVYKGQLRRDDGRDFGVVLSPNHYIRVQVKQIEIDLRISVLGPDSSPVADMDSSEYGLEEISFVSRVSGLHRIKVQAATDSTDRGSYEVQIVEERLSSEQDASEVQAQRLFEYAKRRRAGSKEEMEQVIDRAANATSVWIRYENRIRRAHAQTLLATLEARAGRGDHARAACDDAIRLFAAAGDEASWLEALRALGRLLGHVGVRPKEVPSDEEFVKLWRQTGDRRGIAAAVAAQAGHTTRAGECKQALELESEALRLQREIGDREGEVRSLEGLVGCEMALNDFAAARSNAMEVLRLRRASGDKRGEAAALGSLAVVADAGNQLTEAASYYRQEIALHHAQGDISAEAAERQELAAVLSRGAGTPMEARDQLRIVFQLQGEVTKNMESPAWKAAFEAKQETAAALINLLLIVQERFPNAAYAEEAFLTADEARGSYVTSSIKSLRQATLSEIQHSLDHDSLLLEYWLSNEAGWVWSVTGDGISVHSMPDRGQVEMLSSKAYELLTARSEVQFGERDVETMRRRLAAYDRDASQALGELSRLLLEPVAGALGRKRIMVVAGGALQQIPFGLLFDPLTQDRQPLLAGHEITYLPSAGSLVAKRIPTPAREEAARWFTIVADPVSDGPPDQMPEDLRRAVRAIASDQTALPRLQYAWQEARDISRYAPPNLTKRFVGRAANREALLAGVLANSKLIHFATHGFVNLNDSELSGLLLSTGPTHQQDPFLRLHDIQNLRLSADLVVLSACRTARGAEPRSGGVVSLSSGFLRAGASKVLSTAWKVDDEATAHFMKLFYKRLLEDHQSPAAALRDAQMAMASMPRWHAPYYWGGFVLQARWL
jgi:CHAT domain-containing protein